MIAIQPAGATSADRNPAKVSVFRTKPLKDNTDYAVVMTNDIKDKAGNPIGPGTVAKVLRFTNPLVVGGHSALVGIDDATANALEKMRKQLAPVFALPGFDVSKLAMAYTFHTQTVLEPALQLSALPYTAPTVTGGTGPVTPTDATTTDSPAKAFTKFGVIPAPIRRTHAGTFPSPTSTRSWRPTSPRSTRSIRRPAPSCPIRARPCRRRSTC